MVFRETGRFPATSLPQLYSDLVHAGVILLVVIAATILRITHNLDNGTVGNVYTAAVGYAAGRAGSVLRGHTAGQNGGRRQTDVGDDAAG